jgi:UDP-glucose-4-epimerase GalE
MRVLVTGGAGYIGSHAVRALRRRGFEVRILDNLSTGYARLAEGFELVRGDLRDSQNVAAAVAGVDAVMHFAASAYVGESVSDPRAYFENNVQAGLHLLNAVADQKVRYFVSSSTCAVYGIPSVIPITEETPREPVNPYGASKLFVEHALEAYRMAYSLNYMALRYFNVAGADESGETGELHDPETHLIPRILMVAAGMQPELEVYGNDYPTPDGTCVRDYIHVSDLAEAHVRALEYLVRTGNSAAVNLGTGKGWSVKEVVAAAEKVTGRRIPLRYAPRRAGDPPVLVADGSKARALLGWVPGRTLEQMVSSAWRWLERQNATSRGQAG